MSRFGPFFQSMKTIYSLVPLRTEFSNSKMANSKNGKPRSMNFCKKTSCIVQLQSWEIILLLALSSVALSFPTRKGKSFKTLTKKTGFKTTLYSVFLREAITICGWVSTMELILWKLRRRLPQFPTFRNWAPVIAARFLTKIFT